MYGRKNIKQPGYKPKMRYAVNVLMNIYSVMMNGREMWIICNDKGFEIIDNDSAQISTPGRNKI